MAPSRPSIGHIITGIVLTVGLAWAYWAPLGLMVGKWMNDPHYSHGFLVPAFSAYLLWTRREMLANRPIGGEWLGIPLLAIGGGLYFAGTAIYFEWLQQFALVPSLLGVCVLVTGRRALSWAWMPIAFLTFMIPLPYAVEQALGSRLQSLGVEVSTYVLQTLGLAAIAEGQTVRMEKASIEVVEACNGLGMFFTFLAMSTGLAIVINRPIIDKIFIVLSAAPISIITNIARITVTGFLHETVGEKFANIVYHDLAGWLMMPFALLLLWIELLLLSWLLIEPPAPKPERVRI